jgi:outer membrane protein OmpA-like peptidoglycan-associated protein
MNIYDKELFEPLAAEVRIISESTGEEVANVRNDPGRGYLILNLPIGLKYKVGVNLENFTPESFSFNIDSLVIYRDLERDVELVPEKIDIPINVSDISNGGKVGGKVIIRNKTRDEVIEVQSNEMISLRVGDRYELEATSDKGYFFASTTVDITPGGMRVVEEDNQVAGIIDGAIEIKLTPISVNTSLNLNDILFESGSAQLSDISFTELDRVVDVLKVNPTMRVEIAAHTDDIGAESFNLTLSEKRARSVVEYMVSHNISGQRLVARGYGELKPVVPNDTEDNRYKNRRVELKVLEVLY